MINLLRIFEVVIGISFIWIFLTSVINIERSYDKSLELNRNYKSLSEKYEQIICDRDPNCEQLKSAEILGIKDSIKRATQEDSYTYVPNSIQFEIWKVIGAMLLGGTVIPAIRLQIGRLKKKSNIG